MLVRVVTEHSVWLIPFNIAQCQTGLTCGPGFSIYWDQDSDLNESARKHFSCVLLDISVSSGCFRGFTGFPSDFQGLSKVLGGVCKMCPRFSGSRVLFLSELIKVFQSFVRFCQHFQGIFVWFWAHFSIFSWVFSAAVTDPVCQYLQARCVELKLSCFCKLTLTCSRHGSTRNLVWIKHEMEELHDVNLPQFPVHVAGLSVALAPLWCLRLRSPCMSSCSILYFFFGGGSEIRFFLCACVRLFDLHQTVVWTVYGHEVNLMCRRRDITRSTPCGQK